VIYRFNRSRALQVGIRGMSVLSGPIPGELLVVFEWYIELPSILVVMFCSCSCSVGCFPVVCDMYGSTVGSCFGAPFV